MGRGGVRRLRPTDERGSGSVFVLAIVMVIVTALTAVTVLVSGHATRHRAAAAADLAALAGAEHAASGGPEPCVVARRVARANGAELRDCVVDGGEVEVQVRVAMATVPAWLPDQDRRARAGPER